MKKRLLTACLAVISLASCTTEPKKALKTANCLQVHSEGWCLLDMVGLSSGAKDIRGDEKRDLKINLQEILASSPPKVDGATLALAGLEAISPTKMPGLSSGVPGAIFLFSALASPIKAGTSHNIFALIPESEVKNSDPRITVESHVINAMAQQLGATLAPTPIFYEQKHLVGSTPRKVFKMFGGRCGADGCFAVTEFSYNQNGKEYSFKTIDNLPPFLGSGKAYAVVSIGPNVFKKLDEPYTSGILVKDDFFKILAKLPSWFYYYNPGKPSFVLSSNKLMLMTTNF